MEKTLKQESGGGRGNSYPENIRECCLVLLDQSGTGVEAASVDRKEQEQRRAETDPAYQSLPYAGLDGASALFLVPLHHPVLSAEGSHSSDTSNCIIRHLTCFFIQFLFRKLG